MALDKRSQVSLTFVSLGLTFLKVIQARRKQLQIGGGHTLQIGGAHIIFFNFFLILFFFFFFFGGGGAYLCKLLGGTAPPCPPIPTALSIMMSA